MVPNILRYQALIALLLVGPAAASILYDAQPSIEIRQDTSFASCEAACELGSCGGLCSSVRKLKRDFLSFDDGFLGVANESAAVDSSLEKRVFRFDINNPGYDRGFPTIEQVRSYLPDVDDGGEDAYFKVPLSVVTSSPETEATVSQERRFGDEPFQIMSRGVHGCQVIVVVSDRAVWMTHLWESYSNGKIPLKDEKGNTVVDKQGNTVMTHGKDTLDDPAFDDRILKFLRGVEVTNPAMNERGGYIQPVGGGITADLYTDRSDNTQAFIFTPVVDGESAGSKNILYNNGVNKLIIPTLMDILNLRNPKIVVVSYARVTREKEYLLDSSERGHVLFQFDPNSDNNGKRAWRLIMESAFIPSSRPLPPP
ncbi:hypothetical protein M441DRAFT_29613 [Trichoderma asperellum CBS 433.97]|uniref:Uncharacterized protein n=1 Tax=Trichoderma asperellum (strain ATCC 204424 / CBS 433.97 / NBRC 101777) TaxID=1042311 RepID=A0A2T3Z0A8_TRIA4|nr:hypothetical protein M441DRAFT_29613 [Trichoderma asperellum CBS 433.97]PTB38227.1 hypothetical protein M441DRAFT_29613 [Trichoderma asperellum CBS 433.97]